MKLEERWYRESQEQHFGKRGMSYHGTVVYVNKAAGSPDISLAGLHAKNQHEYQTYYYDDLVRNSQQQDSVAALSLIETAIIRTKRLFPGLQTISFQADNAAAYSLPFLVFALPILARAHGLSATELIHNEAGDGKTVLDGHFGLQTHMIAVSKTCQVRCASWP